MYTLENLQQKNLKELKEIGWQLNVFPESDRRLRRNWIKALVGIQPPLLQLLETSPAAELAAAIFNDEQPPNRGDSGRDRLESQSKVSQSAIAPVAKNSPGVEADCSQSLPGITFSAKFFPTYPPYFGEVHYKADCTGQLNLLEPEAEDEWSDPDDFASIDAFQEAMARWEVENPEPLTVSMDSMCEWARRVRRTGTSQKSKICHQKLHPRSNRPKCWNCRGRSKVPTLATFSSPLLTLRAIVQTANLTLTNLRPLVSECACRSLPPQIFRR
ncbi:MAG: hypothetical protein WCD53_15310 [Microcoleus sp.]